MTDRIALVTGGAGFIGGHLTESLVEDGWRVRVLDDLSTGALANLAPVEGEIEFVRGDIRDPEVVRQATDGARLVFHLAAVASVERCLHEPVETHEINSTGTLRVLEASRAAGVSRLVFASSCAVYGDVGDGAASESRAPAPISPYALHKYTGEIYCRQYTELRGLETAALRFFNVYGPRQDPASVYAAVVPRFAAACLAGEAPTVHGDGEQTRDLVMVADVVRALRLAAEAPGAVGRVCNVGTGRRTSVNQLLSHLLEITESAVEPSYTPPRDGDLRDSVASLEAAREHLGFEASVDLADGLSRTVEAMIEKHARADTDGGASSGGRGSAAAGPTQASAEGARSEAASRAERGGRGSAAAGPTEASAEGARSEAASRAERGGRGSAVAGPTRRSDS